MELTQCDEKWQTILLIALFFSGHPLTGSFSAAVQITGIGHSQTHNPHLSSNNKAQRWIIHMLIMESRKLIHC